MSLLLALQGGGGGDVTLPITGNSITAAAGSVAVAIALGLSGVEGTANAGTITPDFSITVSGNSASGSAGSLGTEFILSLSGSAITANAGTVSSAFELSLSGNSAAADAGSVIYGATTEATDTHDGHYEDIDFDFRRKLDNERLVARERLRNQIRLALEGNPVAVQAVIAPYAQPNIPLESISLDWDAFLADVKAIEETRRLVEQDFRRRQEDELMLMMIL